MRVWMLAEIEPLPDHGTAEVRDWLASGGEGDRRIAEGGGAVWGLWAGAGGFGWDDRTLVLATVWPDEAVAGAAVDLLRRSRVLGRVDGRPLHPTARPAGPAPVTGDGAWVFRDFAVAEADTSRFVELSAAAWETFEARFEATIAGLFRGPADGSGDATFLLVTRYTDLAVWEASRDPARDPDAWARFRERRALTRRTQARAATRIDLG